MEWQWLLDEPDDAVSEDRATTNVTVQLDMSQMGVCMIMCHDTCVQS